VNLILFEPHEIDRPLPRRDRRGRHIVEVLRREAGGSFDAAVVNGPRGKATVVELTDDEIRLSFDWTTPPVAGNGHRITLVVGLPRPQTARDILRDATTLGVDAIHFVRMEKAESSYAQSTLWSAGEWRRHAMLGAEQAFDPRIPAIAHGQSLADLLATLPPGGNRLALDNYEARGLLGSQGLIDGASTTLAIGSERGWSPAERDLLRTHTFTLVQIGSRVLRTETAVTAALAIIRSRYGLM
jgi:RsmE family RNA methyltransferase